jgi:hypothetical protein
MTEQEMIRWLQNHEERIKKLEESYVAPVQTSNSAQKELSIREFLDGFAAKADTDKTLVMMRYYEVFKGKDKITSAEILAGFKEAREVPPQNISDKLQLLCKRGFVMVSGAQGNTNFWTVTNTGGKYLEGLKNDGA